MTEVSRSASKRAVLSNVTKNTSAAFDVRSWQGLTIVLKAVRESGMSSDEYDAFRDVVLTYVQSGGDNELKKQIDTVLSSLSLPLEGVTKKQQEHKEKTEHTKEKISDENAEVTSEQKIKQTEKTNLHQHSETVGITRPAPTFSVSSKMPEVKPASPTLSSGDALVSDVRQVHQSPEPKQKFTPVSLQANTQPVKPLVEQGRMPAPETIEISKPDTTSVSVDTENFKTIAEYKNRISEIKRVVNAQVGNPVALIEAGNPAGREYMNALLAAMKATGGGAPGTLEVSMRRLESAFGLIIDTFGVVTQEKPTGKSEKLEHVQPQKMEKENVQVAEVPTASSVQPMPSSIPTSVPLPSPIPSPSPTPALSPTPAVDKPPVAVQVQFVAEAPLPIAEGKALKTVIKKQTSVPKKQTVSAPLPVVKSALEITKKSPIKASSQISNAITSVVPTQDEVKKVETAHIVKLKPKKTFTKKVPIESVSVEPKDTYINPLAALAFKKPKAIYNHVANQEAIVTDSSASVHSLEQPLEKKTPDSALNTNAKPETEIPPNVSVVQEEMPASAPISQKTPLVTTVSAPVTSVEINDSEGEESQMYIDPAVRELIDAHTDSPDSDVYALKGEMITTGLNELLTEWPLFNGSGIFTKNPIGLVHPLYTQLAPLSMAAITAGRFDNASSDTIDSVRDYVNAWRHEQGISFTPIETFDHYLRRVVKKILMRRNKIVRLT